MTVDQRYLDAARREFTERPTQPRYQTVAVVVTGRIVWLFVERLPR